MAHIQWLSSLLTFAALIPSILGSSAPVYISGTNAQGVTQELLENRTPALYSGNFGDCQGDGGSLINATVFYGAYYADNMTILWGMEGTTDLTDESLMLYISVEAYGENRFEYTFNPCSANFASLCPMNSSVPINVEVIIPVSATDVAAITPLALTIPDFEGSVIARIFSNATETQIACFQAVMRNGASFSHPAAVSSVLGVFTFIALLSSFATAIYGVSVPEIRTHYAHSLSLLVIFEVFHSIFLSGMLSLNWPSVCAAFWSNFAWSAGLIYIPQMIDSINGFVGVSGNSSQAGAAGSTVLSNNGGLQQQIYGRALELLQYRNLESMLMTRDNSAPTTSLQIYKRTTSSNLTTGPSWAGGPVSPGLPIPGNWSGFAGELSVVGIPAADALLLGLMWFLILISCLLAAATIFKWSLELFSTLKWMKADRLSLFRCYWLGFIGVIVLRSMLIAFFMMICLALFQFSFGGSRGITGVTAIIFLMFFAGILGLAFYACFFRLRFGRYISSPDRIHLQRKKLFKVIPWYTIVRESQLHDSEKSKTLAASVSFFRIRYVDNDSERLNVHEDVAFMKRFGWLSARYRRTRWWFFGVWIVYQFVRACFIGGARANPTAQVFGIFCVEVIAAIGIVKINPFEGARNTALAVYMLSISKVATAGLSISFLPQYNVGRLITTVIGVIIIIIQGFLTISVLILIVLGAISSYMSLSRNRNEVSPRGLEGIRLKYFSHLEQKAADLPPPPPPVPEEPKEPYFNVNSVRRAPKIQDEDVDFVPDIQNPAAVSQFSLGNRASRANSMANSMRSHNSTYGTVPFGARVHHASWSSRDFQNWSQQDMTGGRDSPLAAPSRSASGIGYHTANNSISTAPFIRHSASHNNIKPSTPTRETQQQFTSQRVGRAE